MELAEYRRWQTLREADRLAKDVDCWLTRRKNDTDVSGHLGRYDTQLAVISREVLDAVARVRSLAEGDSGDPRPRAELCTEYNLHDQRLVWVRRAWSYFREKLDQRDDETLKPVLEAADEVSWSTYSSFFGVVNRTTLPAPIPYIENDYVPSALRTGQRHVLMRQPGAAKGALEKYFASLPVPLLRLPPSVVTAPWSLALICHEIGHLLQEHVAPQFAFFTEFAELLSSIVEDAGGCSDDRARWSAWSQETFADLSLVSAAGPWAVWVIAPWVLAGEATMREPVENYPPPLTRLILLDAFSREAGLTASDNVLGRLSIDREVVPAPFAVDVAKIAHRTFTINGVSKTLPNFFGAAPLAFADAGRVHQWSEALLSAVPPLPHNDGIAARDAAVAGVRAHFRALASGADLDTLATRVVALIRESYREGKRAGTGVVTPRESLHETLFGMSDDEILI